MKVVTSSISETRKLLMFMEEKMRKEDKLLSGTNTKERTSNGRLFILTKLMVFKPRD